MVYRILLLFDSLLLVTFRRMYLGGLGVVGIREAFFTILGLVTILRLPTTTYKVVGVCYSLQILVAGFAFLFFWPVQTSLIDGLENFYFFVFVSFIFFSSTVVNLTDKQFVTILIFSLCYIFLYQLVIGDNSGGSFRGFVGWPNSTWLTSSIFFWSFYAIFMQRRRQQVGFYIAIIIAGSVMLHDAQRGAFLNLFIVAGLALYRGSILSTLRILPWVLIGIGGMSYLMLLFDERSVSGFFLSIIFPYEYASEYSSGVSRLNQLKTGFEVWSSSPSTILLGVGPFSNVLSDNWNDIHMGYISFLVKYGIVLTLPFLCFIAGMLRAVVINIRERQGRLVDFVCICLCCDALTQTTFDSVPTGAICIFSFSQWIGSNWVPRSRNQALIR